MGFQSGMDHDDDCNRVLTFFTQSVFLNHSCEPNAQMSNPGVSVSITALRDIYPGDEVTICYNPAIPYWDVQRRQEYLKNAWGFVCACTRCRRERICLPLANAKRQLKTRLLQACRRWSR